MYFQNNNNVCATYTNLKADDSYKNLPKFLIVFVSYMYVQYLLLIPTQCIYIISSNLFLFPLSYQNFLTPTAAATTILRDSCASTRARLHPSCCYYWACPLNREGVAFLTNQTTRNIHYQANQHHGKDITTQCTIIHHILYTHKNAYARNI